MLPPAGGMQGSRVRSSSLRRPSTSKHAAEEEASPSAVAVCVSELLQESRNALIFHSLPDLSG